MPGSPDAHQDGKDTVELMILVQQTRRFRRRGHTKERPNSKDFSGGGAGNFPIPPYLYRESASKVRHLYEEAQRRASCRMETSTCYPVPVTASQSTTAAAAEVYLPVCDATRCNNSARMKASTLFVLFRWVPPFRSCRVCEETRSYNAHRCQLAGTFSKVNIQ